LELLFTANKLIIDY